MEDQIIVFELPGGEIRYSLCPAKMKKPGEPKSEWLLRQFNKTKRDNYPGAKRIINAKMPDGQPFAPGAKKLFYGAWRHTGGGLIAVDMPAARAIRMEEIRAERNDRLDVSDKDKARIDDIGTAAQKTAMGAYRQALRDLPATTDLGAVATPEALEAFAPEWPVAP